MQHGTLTEKLKQFDGQWTPRIVAALNGQHAKVAKLGGPFDWHHHEAADEFFLVLDGTLTIEFREEPDVKLTEGDFCVVPSGTEHRPVAQNGEAHVLLFEPADTRNTGTRQTEHTVEALDWI